MIARVTNPIEVQDLAIRAVIAHHLAEQLDPAAMDCVVRCGIKLGKGHYNFGRPEFRDMSSGDAAGGGTWTNEGIIPNAVIAGVNANPSRKHATVETVTGNGGAAAVRLPIIKDTGDEGFDAAENTSLEADEVETGAAQFLEHVFHSGMVFVSNSLARDAGPGFANWLFLELQRRINRRENRHNTRVLFSDVKTNVTAASASAYTINEVLDLIASVPAALDDPTRAKFTGHPTVWAALQKIKDGATREWKNAGLDKFEFVCNSAMPTIASGAKCLIFGNLGMLTICETLAMTLVIASETRAEKNQSGYLAKVYSDAALADLQGLEIAALALA